MRIAIMGSGGLGGFYGGRLAQDGNEVNFIARGKHLSHIRRHGLKLIGPEEIISLDKVVATEDPSEIGFVDVILFCVKLYDVEAAANLIKPIVSQDTIIVSVLNGINGPDRLFKSLNKGVVFGGSARVSARISNPGVITFLGQNKDHKLTFGHPDCRKPQNAIEFCNICNRAKIPTQITNEIEVELWDKLVQLTCVAGLTTLSRKPIGFAMKDRHLFEMGKKILREVEAVARAKNIKLAANIFETKINLICSFPDGLYASMYHDLILGRRIEVEDIFGYLSQEGRAVSVPTPVIDMIYAFLKPHISGQCL